jgi:hypothetical protein
MGSLALTIDQTMSSIGGTARGVLTETLREFELMTISDEERVSAIATALAATAIIHHRRHVGRFLDAVRVWALETGGAQSGIEPDEQFPRAELVAEAADLVCSGMETLLDELEKTGAAVQDRAVAELTLYTRLFERMDIHTALQALGAVVTAVATPGFRAGDLVHVPLMQPLPVRRDADLTTLPTRGLA